MTINLSHLPENIKRPLRPVREFYRFKTAGMRVLPSCLIVGAQRAGTTTLFNYLMEHPEVRFPFKKEIHFFDFRYHMGMDWYRSCFCYEPFLGKNGITLEASPYYMIHPLVPERVANSLPGVKIIMLLRNPVDRALSQYHHNVRHNREKLSFEEALEKDPERLEGEVEKLKADGSYYSYNHHRYAYILRGRYMDHIEKWLQSFNKERVLLIQAEKMFMEPKETCNEVFEFLGLSSWDLRNFKHYHKADYDRNMSAASYSDILRYFEDSNQRLFNFLGYKYDW